MSPAKRELNSESCTMKTFGDRAIAFYSELEIREKMPEGVEVMNPYREPGVMSVIGRFFRKFYRDNRERVILLGINPGRFGAGVTGITFTDPLRLEKNCGISNSFTKRPELSSGFVYEVIRAFGGVDEFFGHFFLSAVSPLGFTRSGKNLNYYDEPALEDALKEFIHATLKKQAGLGIRRDKVLCLGEGKNFRYLQKLNRETGLFTEILTLPHPRWVMQYRYRRRDEFIREYLGLLKSL
jgi:hypothetical protein